ncbi:HalOD1 output domain-containing protein [Halobaculum roseum]|uniref:HalOD1 output domain-containing protein n=1 Tax=Halobaculum roseum TaxID=2175149 RepID=A0ABD5MNG5_9EURY|nr:hypothetical protein K6T36_04125 [Halobaculum roseum]
MNNDLLGERKKTGEYDWEEVEPTVAIFELIAKFEHEENTETVPFLNLPLHTYVDTDALTTLVQSNGLVSISLNISHYHVQIHGNTVEITTVED